MTPSKRHKIHRIALGLAIAALVVPASAQARPMDMTGDDSRLLHEAAVAKASASSLVGSEDVAFSRSPAESPAVSADESNGYNAGVGSLGALVLILAAAGAAVAVHHSKRAKLTTA